jgi:hypothetical protein
MLNTAIQDVAVRQNYDTLLPGINGWLRARIARQ